MFQWIKRRILKSIVKDVIKSLPSLKEQGLKLLKEHKDELLDKLQEVIKKTVKDFVASKINH